MALGGEVGLTAACHTDTNRRRSNASADSQAARLVFMTMRGCDGGAMASRAKTRRSARVRMVLAVVVDRRTGRAASQFHEMAPTQIASQIACSSRHF